MDADIVILPDTEALARNAAQRFADLAREAAESRGRFSAVLSGGSTPAPAYRLLAEEPWRSLVPWADVHLFWGDERCVPPDDPESNYHLADVALISRVSLPPENIHRMQGELGPRTAADLYEEALVDYFCGPWLRFDLAFLGLGEDGHIASLFPGSSTLEETEKLALPAEARYQNRPAKRVTLTLPALNSSRQVLFLVSGEAKAGIVQAVLEGPEGHYPAQRIQPAAGELTWLLDEPAASRLRKKDGKQD